MTDDQVATPSSPSAPKPRAVPAGWYAWPDGTSAWWDGANWLTSGAASPLPASSSNADVAPIPMAVAGPVAPPFGGTGLPMSADGSVGRAADDSKPRPGQSSIASMMLGIASVVILVLSLSVSRSGLMLLFAALAAVFAVLLGHISRSKVQGRPGLKSASSMTGVITGYVGLGLSLPLLGLAYLISFFV